MMAWQADIFDTSARKMMLWVSPSSGDIAEHCQVTNSHRAGQEPVNLREQRRKVWHVQMRVKILLASPVFIEHENNWFSAST